MMAMELSPELARAILKKLGESGHPPDYGVEHFTVGLDQVLGPIRDEYFNGDLQQGLSSFKLVVGYYGGGKTHLFYCIRNLAWEHNFAVTYVSLSPQACPFDKLELVYKEAVASLPHPMDPSNLLDSSVRGIRSFIEHWFERVRSSLESEEGQGPLDQRLFAYAARLPNVESVSFKNALKGAFEALITEDDEAFDTVVAWLSGEGYDRRIHSPYRITERIDKTTAFRMLRSLAQWIRQIGYNGLVVLFDEGERFMSLRSSKNQRQALENIRQIIDECGTSRLPGVMVFYAVPDTRSLLEGNSAVYEALRGRLKGAFDTSNPCGPKISLEDITGDPHEFLAALGSKLADLFMTGYGVRLAPDVLQHTIEITSRVAYKERYADIGYRRLFVKMLVFVLHRLRSDPGRKVTEDEIRAIASEQKTTAA